MALTLTQIRSIGDTNDTLRGRFEGAMVKAAWTVLAEDGATENHVNRLALAKKILLDQTDMIEKYYLFYLSNTTIQGHLEAGTDPTDGEIYYVVLTELYNTVANADVA